MCPFQLQVNELHWIKIAANWN